jgi:hypothetical protein
MNAHLVQLGLTALVTCAAGCTRWSRLPDGRPLPARGTVQVWSAGKDILLRDPETVGDSLVGQGPYADTTRRTVALTTIDSLRIQTADMGKVVIVGSAVAIAVLLAYAEGFEGMGE